jgi:hypothetical protein
MQESELFEHEKQEEYDRKTAVKKVLQKLQAAYRT